MLSHLSPVRSQPDFIHAVSHLPMTVQIDRGSLLAGVHKTSMPWDMREFLECDWNDVLKIND